MSLVYLGVSLVVGIPSQIGNFAAQLSDYKGVEVVFIALGSCCGILFNIFVGLPLAAWGAYYSMLYRRNRTSIAPPA
ncbi:MAG: hypothetical protein EXS10_02935 [Phycisphaerales bacterium]|nr:hypothetical protein [Phycisphaerales bacterium]